MIRPVYKGKLCAMTLGVMAFASAGAQESDPAVAAPQAEQTEAAAPAPAAQQAAAPDYGDELSEVIVTARRIQERLQDVPISITVFNQEQLTDRNVSSASDLATYTPSLSSNTRFGSENASYSIRGFSQEQRTTASVGVYFADVVAPRAGSVITGGDGAGPGAFFDLANVQVLKGPQGTLFGRNTTGGAVLLVPQKPTGSYEGFLETSLGNYDLQHTTAVVNAPISDSVRMRLGVDRKQRDGYLNNNSKVGPNDFADIGYTAYRLSLVADITENIENYTIASYSDSKTNGNVPRVVQVDGTGAYDNVYRNSFPFNALLSDQLSRGGDFYTVSSAEPRAFTRNLQWQLINSTSWAVSDNLTIKGILSYAELQNDVNESFYGGDLRMPEGRLPIDPRLAGVPCAMVPTGCIDAADAGLRVFDIGAAAPAGLHMADQSTMSAELQFQGLAFDGALNWQAGGYFEQSRALNPNGSQSQQFIHCDDTGTLDCYDVLGKYITALQGTRNYVGSLGYQVGEIDYKNFGVYFQGTYSITDALSATAGLRYTDDQMSGYAINGRHIFTGANYNTPEFYCSNSQSGQPTGPGGTDADGNPTTPGVADINLCRVAYEKKTNAPTWVLGLDYKINDQLMAYGKWSRGYRQGGVSPVSAGPAAVWDEEQVDTYELGFKSEFRGAVRGTFNVAAFYNDFRDQQLSAGFQQTNDAAATYGSVPPNVGIVNAGKSSIYGVEVESVLIPARGLNVSLSYAWLKSEIKQVDQVPTEAPYDIALPLAYKGDPLPYTPEQKLSATVIYTLPLDAKIGAISFGPTISYQSSYLVDGGAKFTMDKNGNLAPSPYGEVGGRTLINLNLNWNNIYGSPVDLGLFATNLTDKKYYTAYTGGLTRFGYEGGFVGEPLMYGARVRVSFGS